MIDNLQQWWLQLEPQWKDAFLAAYFLHGNEPTLEELAQLFSTPVLRLVGPAAPHPNLKFELTNLSGLNGLTHLETLIITHHKIEMVEELRSHKNLKHLFLNDNQIVSLSGIQDLIHLEMLYAQNNKLQSFRQVAGLHKLRELYVNGNLLENLDGLTLDHEQLEVFFCKPNDTIKQRDMLKVEQELGIRCRSL